MPYQLFDFKQSLTRYSEELDEVIMRFKNIGLITFSIPSMYKDIPLNVRRNYLEQFEEGLQAIELIMSNIERLLKEYTDKFNGSKKASESCVEDFVKCSDMANKSLCAASDYTVILRDHIGALKSDIEETQTSVYNQPSVTIHGIEHVGLPSISIPIPIFSGDVWEWENFWELFSRSLQSKCMSDLEKFKYLRSLLGGEALESVKKLHLGEQDYNGAVAFLKQEYGNPKKLVSVLYDKLDKCILRSPNIHDQETLLEHLDIIIQQLVNKGENLDGMMMTREILRKFPRYTMRKVVEKKRDLPVDNRYKIQQLLQCLKDVISVEKEVLHYSTNYPLSRDRSAKSKQIAPAVFICMYCRRNHKSFDCDNFKTAKERCDYLRSNNLCLICASSKHSTSKCKKSSCRKCQKRHHTSCCLYTMQESTSNNGSVKAIEVEVNKSKESKIESSYSNTAELDRFRQEPTEQSSTMKVIVGGIRLGTLKGSQTSFLPIGEVTVLDPKTRKLEKISVLLSTGTSVSFIDPALAKTLGLRTIKKSKLQVHTVLSEEVEEEMFCEVKLDAWDTEGQPLSWTLYLYDIFHRTFTLPLISLEDIKFMRQNNIVADFNRKLTVKPSIQLGCDQAWPIFGSNQSFVRLPSGLRLLSTRLGSLFIGRIRSPLTDRLSVDEHSN